MLIFPKPLVTTILRLQSRFHEHRVRPLAKLCPESNIRRAQCIIRSFQND